MKIKIEAMFSLFLELVMLTSCNSFMPAFKTQPTQAMETALAIVGTAMAETQTAIPTATSTPTPLPTVTPMPTFSPVPTTEPGWGYDYIATVPVASVGNATQDEIAKLLFIQRLNHFKTEGELDDYEFLSVDLSSSVREGLDFVAVVGYSVKPSANARLFWDVGNGIVSPDDSWIRNKVLFIGIRKEKDFYSLIIIGTGP